MHANRSQYSLQLMCRELGVSRQGYNKWLKGQGKPGRHEALLALIMDVLNEDIENKANYGAKRIYLALANNGWEGSYSTVCRVCRKYGLTQPKKKKAHGITAADAKAQKSENLIAQDFRAEEPNAKWLSDITEVQCSDGKLYASVVLDCFDGAIVGLAMEGNMRKELCISAFEQACQRYSAHGMVFHSDRGSQCTSGDFRACLAQHGAIQSMSGTGRCFDNARAESFFATLKKEKLYQINTASLPMETVKSIIWRYIEIYYNKKRVYTTNAGYPPLVFRSMHYASKQRAA
ncbi:MAG: IS3 family transposase [Eubacteriaceae bacterium]|nr:IS3 family transposase [Eubacteriaceae bacterium]